MHQHNLNELTRRSGDVWAKMNTLSEEAISFCSCFADKYLFLEIDEFYTEDPNDLRLLTIDYLNEKSEICRVVIKWEIGTYTDRLLPIEVLERL